MTYWLTDWVWMNEWISYNVRASADGVMLQTTRLFCQSSINLKANVKQQIDADGVSCLFWVFFPCNLYGACCCIPYRSVSVRVNPSFPMMAPLIICVPLRSPSHKHFKHLVNILNFRWLILSSSNNNTTAKENLSVFYRKQSNKTISHISSLLFLFAFFDQCFIFLAWTSNVIIFIL